MGMTDAIFKKVGNSRKGERDKIAWEKAFLAVNKTISSAVHSLTKTGLYHAFN